MSDSTALSQPLTMNCQEWGDEARRRFGRNDLDFRFECPACRRIYSIAEFVAAGGNKSDAPYQCIGRANGKGFDILRGAGPDGNAHGCDYTAGDLIFPGQFMIVINTIPLRVMPFAPAVDQVKGGEER